MSDPWEDLRHLTLDKAITATKLSGSSMVVNGFTTPEGWPFCVVIAVAKPGNERAVELAREFHMKMQALTHWSALVPPAEPVVHLLNAGLPLCDFSREEPRDWPPGHRWTGLADRAEATCAACLAKAKR